MLERKRRLRAIMPRIPSRLLYVDHVRAGGVDRFCQARAHDLEGIVGKSAPAKVSPSSTAV